eukprot:m.28447 g.28447  ORF g.28447 m.28447 type:complete len:333 (+) comp12019_c0_seq2:38-1036(+)
MAGTASFLLASACRYAREEDEFASLQPHERESVRQHLLDLRSAHAQVQQRLGGLSIRARELSDDAKVSATSTAKKIHFIRHGQGFHNAKQKEWRSNPAWDGKTEPYTLETDPDFKLIDPKLTPLGESEAVALRPRANKLSPEVMVVSPMRRATQTGLLAFDQHVVAGRLSVVACELAHEISGKHTCDKRLPVATLKATFPMVDYDGIVSEDDPFWGDGMVRRRPISPHIFWFQSLRIDQVYIVMSPLGCACSPSPVAIKEEKKWRSTVPDVFLFTLLAFSSFSSTACLSDVRRGTNWLPELPTSRSGSETARSSTSWSQVTRHCSPPYSTGS